MTSRLSPSHIKNIWIINGILAFAAIFIALPHQTWLLSIWQNSAVKSFDGAIMPIAFIPDWKKWDYVDRRHEITYQEVYQEDLIPLPDYKDLKNDFNSLFTYITVFKWSYMDEERVVWVWSHNWVDIRAPMQTPVFSIWNGIVTKVRNDDNNKYVVVEHRNVRYNNTVWKYYSSYLHLDSVTVNVWDIINKWSMIGRVGMSWITTTPHLHLQIDNENAPFYPYWPFSIEEAWSANMSFFDGVSNGLNKNLIDEYSVDPMHFIKNAKSVDSTSIKTFEDTQKWDVQTNNNLPQKEIIPQKNSQEKFTDLTNWDKYFTAIEYFSKRWLVKWFEDGTFRPNQIVTRSEILGIVLKALWISHHWEILVGIFQDVPKDHWVTPLISVAVKKKIVSTDRPFFEPNRAVTRAEFLAILWRASGKKMSDKVSKKWNDIEETHWSQKYAEFAFKYKLFDDIGWNTFDPNRAVTRGEIVQAMYIYLKNIWKV